MRNVGFGEDLRGVERRSGMAAREDAAPRVREVLSRAELVVASDLTLVECDRVLIRAVALGEVEEAAAADRRSHLNAAAAHWHLLRLSADIVDRARQPFPAGTDPHARRDSPGVGAGSSFRRRGRRTSQPR